VWAAIALALASISTAHAATITVNSLSDAGAPGICVLRDAITAANTKTATNGCAAGTGNDTINFRVTGTISLAKKLPQITDGRLAIIGPSPSIKIDGGGKVQVMRVASAATVSLSRLTIADGLARGDGGGILNNGRLTVTYSSFSGNFADEQGGGIYNGATLRVRNSNFSGNFAEDQAGFDAAGGGIFNDGTLTVVNSAFDNNASGDFSAGGGIENAGGLLTVRNSTFVGNFGHDGGGIDNAGLLIVVNSTFDSNACDHGCGVEIYAGGTGVVDNSTFNNNSGLGAVFLIYREQLWRLLIRPLSITSMVMTAAAPLRTGPC
jgi:hypothetical protein